MGIYDSLVMDNGQYPQTIDADQWLQDERAIYMSSIGVERGSFVEFTYTIENHSFSEYSAEVEVAVTNVPDRQTLLEFSDVLSAGAFEDGELTWSLDTSEMIPADYPTEQNYNLNVNIKRGEIVRTVTVNIYPAPVPAKPVVVN